MESLITDYKPAQQFDLYGEPTAAGLVSSEVRKGMAQTAARHRTRRLIKSYGREATRRQFVDDAWAVAKRMEKLMQDIRRWTEYGWLDDGAIKANIESRNARNEHHATELESAAEALREACDEEVG